MKLFVRSMDGQYLPTSIETVLKEVKSFQFEEKDKISSAISIVPILAKKIGKKKVENFVAVFMDNANHIIGMKTMSKGIENQTAVYPKEIVRIALMKRATAVIISHNHPAGILTPSLADETITKNIQECLKVFEIRFLDHIIVGNDGGLRYFSFQENGKIAMKKGYEKTCRK